MLYYQKFTVTLRPFQTFPIDMLRYDACFPHSERDSALIETRNAIRDKDLDKPLEIKIARYTRYKDVAPTIGRWASFGVKVSDIETLKQ